MRSGAILRLGFMTVAAISGVGCGSTAADGVGSESIDALSEGLTYQVGPGKAYASLQAVASSLKPGDVVQVYGGATYSGGINVDSSGTANSKIKIVGVRVNGKRPVISGGTNSIEFSGNHIVFEGFDVTGGSSRCVFHHGDDITIRDSVIHDCPAHGILGADSDSGSLTLEYSEVYHSGSGDRKHQIYIATDETAYPGAVFRMRYNYVHDGNGGNNVKTRAERNEIYYNWIEGAYYHELELIGPDGQDPDLKREDSDVVGNVIYQGYVSRSHPAIRIGGDGSDGTGESFGRFRFLNNTVVLGSASTAPVFRVFDGIESVEMHNNALFRQGGQAVNVLTDDDANWRHGRQIAGKNNWVTSGSSGIPSSWTGTRQGADPGFVNVAGRNLTPSSSSPLADAGTSAPAAAAGYAFPSPLASAGFEPPQHAAAADGVAVVRAPVGATDIGAFERGNTGKPTTPPTTAPTTPGGPTASAPVTLYPTEDTFARSGTYADTTFGDADVLNVKSDAEPNFTRDAYLRFNLGSLASATNAKFRVYAALSDADSIAAALYPVTASWSAATLTWNTRPSYVSSPLGSFTAASTTFAWKEIDVTSHIKKQLSAGLKLVSFALHSTADSVEKLIINSSEAAANRPQLVVTP